MKKIIIALAVLGLSGCSWFTRDQKTDTNAHRDEKTVKTIHKVGNEGGQPVDVTTTETDTTVRDDTKQTQSHTEVTSPALEQAAASLASLVGSLGGGGIGSGIITTILQALGLNQNTAAGLASVGAAGAGYLLHQRGRNKGHAEAKASMAANQHPAQPVQQQPPAPPKPA